MIFGAIALDTIAFFKLIFSDWIVVGPKKQNRRSWIAATLGRYLGLKRPTWSTDPPSCLQWARKFLFRRWSEYVSTFNLIDYCLKERPKSGNKVILFWGLAHVKVISIFGLKDLCDKMKHMSSKPLDKKLCDFIFGELEKKSLLADDPEIARRICSARGDWVLQESRSWDADFSSLMRYIAEVDYDERLLFVAYCY